MTNKTEAVVLSETDSLEPLLIVDASEKKLQAEAVKDGFSEEDLAIQLNLMGKNALAQMFLRSVGKSLGERRDFKKAEFEAELATKIRRSKKDPKVSYVEYSLVQKKQEGYLQALEEVEQIIELIVEQNEAAQKPKGNLFTETAQNRAWLIREQINA